VLQQQQDAARLVVPTDRLASIVLEELTEGPKFLPNLVQNTATRLGGDQSPETIARLQVQIASLIDGKGIGVVQSGRNAGQITILAPVVGTAVRTRFFRIGFATNREHDDNAKSPGGIIRLDDIYGPKP